jgi:hypothetical protein
MIWIETVKVNSLLHALHSESHRGSNKRRRNSHHGKTQGIEALNIRRSIAIKNGKGKDETYAREYRRALQGIEFGRAGWITRAGANTKVKKVIIIKNGTSGGTGEARTMDSKQYDIVKGV